MVNCDFISSGSSTLYSLNFDLDLNLIGCRFEVAGNADCVRANGSMNVCNCVFLKNGSLGGNGIYVDASGVSTILHSTFYNFTYAIRTDVTSTLYFIRNHVTDCTKFVDSSTLSFCYEIQNRTRDNTSPPATVELINIGEITTDTGGPSTDYNNTATGDLHLITTAAGYNAGWDGSDIGGLQTNPPASSGGSALHLGQLGQTGIGHF
jgi:hypothetical protein